MIDALNWTHIGLVFASSILLTVLVFAGLIWRDYRRDRHKPTRK